MPDEQQAQQPLNPDLMGYPSVEALVAAKRASDQEAVRLRERANRADELEAQLAQAAQNAFAANPRQAVPDRSKPGWYNRIEAQGIDPEPIMEAFREWGRQVVQEELQPIYQMGTARTAALGKHKDYAQFEADIGQWINSDPKRSETYAKVFKADPVAAFDWAYYEFGADRRKEYGGGEPQANGATHAQIPSQRSGDSRQQQFSADIGLEQAAQAYRENPSKLTAERYAKARLAGVVTDEHLFGGMSGR